MNKNTFVRRLGGAFLGVCTIGLLSIVHAATPAGVAFRVHGEGGRVRVCIARRGVVHSQPRS
jgi:hypothetical protein